MNSVRHSSTKAIFLISSLLALGLCVEQNSAHAAHSKKRKPSLGSELQQRLLPNVTNENSSDAFAYQSFSQLSPTGPQGLIPADPQSNVDSGVPAVRDSLVQSDPIHQDSLTQILEELEGANHDWDSTLNDKFEDIHNAVNNTNQQIEAILNPITSAMAGAASNLSVMGVSLGFVGTAAGYALTLGIEQLVERITHAQHNTDKLNAFLGAIKNHIDVTTEIEATEPKFMSSLSLMKLIRSAGGRAALIKQLGVLAEEQKHSSTLLQKIISTSRRQSNRENPAAREKIQKLIEMKVTLDGYVRQSEKLVLFLESSTDNDVCKEIRDGIVQLNNLENKLEGSRLSLVDREGQKLYSKAMHDAYLAELAMTGQFKDAAKELTEGSQEEEAEAKARYEAQVRADADLAKAVDQAYKACLDKQKKVLHLYYSKESKEYCKNESLNPISDFMTADDVCKGSMTSLCKNKDVRLAKIKDDLEKRKDIEFAAPPTGLFEHILDNFNSFRLEIEKTQSKKNRENREQHLEQVEEEVRTACDLSFQN